MRVPSGGVHKNAVCVAPSAARPSRPPASPPRSASAIRCGGAATASSPRGARLRNRQSRRHRRLSRRRSLCRLRLCRLRLGPPCTPSAAQWRPGAPWPHACVGPGGLPELYPAPALWVRDIDAFYARLPPGFPHFPVFMLQPYVQQVELDERFALLTEKYAAQPGGASLRRPLSEHAPLFAACGLTLRMHDTGLPVNVTDIFSTPNGYGVDFSVKPRHAAARFCDKCKKPAAARCRCGEAYCSRTCQAAHWTDHRSICAVVQDNHQLGLYFSSIWWAMRGVGKARK